MKELFATELFFQRFNANLEIMKKKPLLRIVFKLRISFWNKYFKYTVSSNVLTLYLSVVELYLFQFCDCILNMVYQNTVIILSIERSNTQRMDACLAATEF